MTQEQALKAPPPSATVIGASAAGLHAATQLARAGLRTQLFEAKYQIMVHFKRGTPDHQLGFIGLPTSLRVGKVVKPEAYRIDVVFTEAVRYPQMRKMLQNVRLKPPLGRF